MKFSKMLTPIKASVISFAIALAAASLYADDLYWVGTAGDSAFKTAENWDPVKAPTASDTVHFTNDVTVTCAAYSGFCGVTVADGCTVTMSNDNRYQPGKDGNGELVIYVGEDATLTVSGWMYGNLSSTTFVKDGPGVLTSSSRIGNSDYLFGGIEVRGGTLKCALSSSADGWLYVVAGGIIRICDGANITLGGSNKQWLRSTAILQIDEGGVYSGGTLSAAQTIRGLTGGGTVKGSAPLKLSLAGGPYVFSGSFASGTPIVLAPSEYVAGETELVLGSGMAFANGLPTVSGVETSLASIVKFASGVAEVAIPIDDASGLQFFDVDGNPLPNCRYLPSGTTYVHDAEGDDHWTERVFGTGDITEKSGGTWTIDSLSLTGGTFTVDGATLGTNLVLNGGVSTDMAINPKSNYTVTFGGIDVQTPSALRTYYGHTFVQTAGTVDASPVSSGYNSEQDEREIGYFISGGTLISRPDNSNFSMGLGLEASGDAHVILKDGAKGPHSLIHNAGGTNYCRRLCVRGNALVEVENLKFYYYKGAGAGTTGTVEIAENGVLSLKGRFGSEGDYVPNAGQVVRLEFDGGTLRSDQQENVDVPSYPNSLPDDMKVAYVREGGACFDVPRTNRAAKLTSYWTVRSDVADGKDGGIRKTGGGLMTFAAPVSTTGPVAIEDGNIVNTRSGSSVLGSGSLVLGDKTSLMMDNTAAAKLAYGTGAQVKFSGNATIRLTKLDVGLELGDESDATVPFVREGRGYLTFMAGNGGGSAGSDSGNDFRRRPITLHSGALANASCGILSAPVFGWVWGQTDDGWGHNRGSKDLRFMAYNSESGLLDIAHSVQTNAIPAGSDESTLAYFHNNQTVTLSADAKVGAMTVYGGNHRSDAAASRIGGVSISQGVTLTVGSDELGCAPIVMDNKYVDTTDYGPAIIGGKGTLDFGAREGLIGLNLTYANSGVRLPARIECTVAGTGGLTVFAPYVDVPVDGGAGFDAQDTVRALRLSGENTYGGGTYVDNAIVLPVKATSLGTGAVTLSCKDGVGGALFFDDECTTDEFANAITVAGNGFGYTGSSEAYISRWGLGGAISTLKSLKLTGAITLTDDATIKVDGEDSVLTLAGGVSGSGKLTVIGTGTLSVGSAISCDGGVGYQVAAVEIRPLDAGELTIPAAQVPAGATIVVDPTGAVDGCGVVTVDGDLDLGTVSVRFSERQRFYKGARFTFLKTTGKLTGTLDPSLLPSDRWHFEYADDSVTAVYDRTGMLLLVR